MHKAIALDFNTVTIGIEFEQNSLAPKHKQVGVFRDDSIDQTFLFQLGQLCISFIRCNNVRYTLCTQDLDQLIGHRRRNIDATHECITRS